MNEVRICSKCEKEKPVSEFFRDRQKKSGIRPDCKECNTKRCSAYAKNNRKSLRFTILKYKYGITKKEYERLFEVQGGKCAICKITSLELGKNLSVDHSHTNLKVRGLLCFNCNAGLGSFKDDEELLKTAITYLQNNN